MRIRHLTKLIALVTVGVLGACTNTTPQGFESDGTQSSAPGITQHQYIDVCGRVRPGGGTMRCNAKVVVNPDGTIHQDATPSGLGPPDFRSAYALPTSGGNGR